MSYIPFPDISPNLITVNVWGVSFALRWYALAYISGILIGWMLVRATIRRPQLWANNTAIMTSEQLERLVTWVILGVILGGRLGFVLFYEPAYYMENPMRILMVWAGGMSFHGGFLGVLCVTALFAWKEKIPFLSLADLMALAAPPGLMLGRIANFINAELWGRPTNLPWGVAFPGDMAQSCAYQMAQNVCARHPSQLYEAALEGVVLGVVLLLFAWRCSGLHRPGRVSGVFLAGYGLARFLVEFVRQPDAQFISAGNPLGLALHLNGYGLTMGQLLSVPMIIIGIYFVLRRRNTG